MSTFTPNCNLEKIGDGELDNSWGATERANQDKLDDMLRGYLSKSVAGGSNVTLSETEWNHNVIKLTGAITANISVNFPDRQGQWKVINETTGPFNITCKTASGSGVVVDRYDKLLVASDGTNLEALEPYKIGELRMFGQTTAPSRWVAADGSALSRTTYARLFDEIGERYGAGNGSTTFNVIDLRGRSPMGPGQGDTAEGGGTGTSRSAGDKVGQETDNHLHSAPTHTHGMGNHTHLVSGSTGGPSNTTSGQGAGPDAVASDGHTHTVGITSQTPSTNTTDANAAANTGQSVIDTVSPAAVVPFYIYAGV